MRREITGLIALSVFAVCILWQYGVWLGVATATVAFFFAHAEMYHLLNVKRRMSLLVWQNTLACFFLFFTALHGITSLIIIVFLFFWGSCLITIHHSIRGSRYEISVHGLLLIYLLFPLSCFVYLRSIEHGPVYLFFMLVLACFTDIGAYYGGRLWGKHKLAPVISPNKTWEGAVCGAVFSAALVLTTAACQSFWYQKTLWLPGAHRYGHILLVALLLSAMGQIGDLFESAMKRDAGVKDSGSSITGHGGFLDMMDSMLWIGPAMLVYLVLFR